MRPPETQTCPASSDTGTWTSFERLLPEKFVTNIRGARCLRNYHTHYWSFQETTDFWTSSEASESSWRAGYSFSPAWAVQKGGHSIASACPEQPLNGPWTTTLTFLFHLFHYFCKRGQDLAGVNVIWPVWLLFNSQLSLSQPANSQLITASQQIQALHQAREF